MPVPAKLILIAPCELMRNNPCITHTHAHTHAHAHTWTGLIPAASTACQSQQSPYLSPHASTQETVRASKLSRARVSKFCGCLVVGDPSVCVESATKGKQKHVYYIVNRLSAIDVEELKRNSWGCVNKCRSYIGLQSYISLLRPLSRRLGCLKAFHLMRTFH
jgi:hypothetical protein